MDDELGVWVYAVTTSAPGPEELAGLSGVAGEPLRPIEMTGLTAIAGTVRLDEFGEEPLRRKLDDLDSLEAIARAHHDVVAFVARHAPTVPMRLATVYRDDVRAGAMLAERHDDFLLAFKQITGRTEWGVKAYATNTAAAAEDETASAPDRPGTAYLLRRKAQLSATDDARQKAINAAREVHETLSALAVAARLHPPQDPQLTGEAGMMILNGAYLIEDEATERFAAEVRAMRDRHPALRLELTGPWPAYTFAAVEGTEATGDSGEEPLA